MRKICIVLLTLFLINLTILPANAMAYDDYGQESSFDIKLYDDRFYTKLANELNKIGLLQGTDNGYELDRQITRAEGATIILRLITDEEKVNSYTPLEHPFTDVPDWANKNIGYLYNAGYISGISKDKFGSQRNMSAKDFVTLILRVLEYKDDEGDFSWETSLDKAVEIGLLNEQYKEELESREFLRKDVAYITYRALFTHIKDRYPVIYYMTLDLEDRIVGEGYNYQSNYYTFDEDELVFKEGKVYWGELPYPSRNSDIWLKSYDDKVWYIVDNKLHVYDGNKIEKILPNLNINCFVMNNGKMYIGAYKDEVNEYEALNIYEYDLSSKTLEKVGDLPSGYLYTFLLAYDDVLYYSAYHKSDFMIELGDFYKHNLKTNERELVVDSKISRSYLTVYDNKIYYCPIKVIDEHKREYGTLYEYSAVDGTHTEILSDVRTNEVY